MADYKHTLNLPHTSFPMKANLPQREPEILARWQAIDVYQQQQAARAGAPQFLLHDGPPYANGRLHLGHTLNKTLKDIILKAKALAGFATPYIPGWDCHGLPIELNVEKKVGKPGVKVSPAEFRQACREYAAQQVDIQRETFVRLGVFADWDNPYLTMDYAQEAETIRALASILKQGYVYQGAKPVHWCLDCASALAEAEVEYADKTSPAIDVAFPIVAGTTLAAGIDASLPLSILIWTTTPWTLPANQAVSVHPQLCYEIIRVQTSQGAQQWVVAEQLRDALLARVGIEDYQLVASMRGEQLDGVMCQHPFYARQVPIILGEHVTTDVGTGAVHTAPAHGLDDYVVGQKNQLPIDNPVLGNGCFTQDTPLFAGMHVFKANQAVIDVLQEKQHLVHQAALTHSYPHCWRHKSPIIFRATAQWFIGLSQNHLRDKVLAAVAGCEWIPEWGEARINLMMQNRPDWCISRQRVWGVPMCFLTHKETGALHPDMPELMEQVALQVEQRGIDAWYDFDWAACIGEESEHYEASTDTLDVWFDSGVTHAAVMAKRLSVPADLYLEGSDQYRGWFNTSLLTAVAMRNAAPTKAFLTHGFIVDEQGNKMSKSLGNVIDPESVIKNLGADVLRLMLASADYRAEVNVSDEILQRAADSYRRIRNTARYLLSNLHDFDPAKHVLPSEQLLALDQYIVAVAAQTQAAIVAAYDAYQFHSVVQKIHHFCAIDLGGFYLDIIKDRQYTLATDSHARRSAQTAMFHLAEALVRWLAPILSFTADEIWQYLPGERGDSVFLTTYYTGLSDLPATAAVSMTDWQQVLVVRDAVNKQLEQLRNAGQIKAGLSADVQLFVSPELLSLLSSLGEELHFIFITATASCATLAAAPAAAVETDVAGLKLFIAPSPHTKCERCWHFLASVGQDTVHPTLCARCIGNISEQPEQRQYA